MVGSAMLKAECLMARRKIPIQKYWQEHARERNLNIVMEPYTMAEPGITAQTGAFTTVVR